MVLHEFQDCGHIKKNLRQSDGSLKGDLSIDTTFDPPLNLAGQSLKTLNFVKLAWVCIFLI
jgi:hypothetical protein